MHIGLMDGWQKFVKQSIQHIQHIGQTVAGKEIFITVLFLIKFMIHFILPCMFRILCNSEICIYFEKQERMGGEHWLPTEFWDEIRRENKRAKTEVQLQKKKKSL